ncbi:response regulator transcription factor [Nocardioides pocheonensis]|jgi:DNA-binding response OmpR family regulator|uniref:DNA-binding response regulator n=1 Tax=Nocardioides pocheonensis TaxID=661485 RepID=A0A3N0GUI4_9ACTN|nr:response regulator transcription factor [Nocardioides pocheonensis]RNM15780.1 DNA-binding response regulator [Nocardioides pocheonensis]
MSTLLVVDDEPRVVTLLTRFLVAEGHSVITAPDGLAALELLRDKQVDLILLDLVMPRCNGLQLLGRMVETLQEQPPVIVLSCVNEVAARVQALDRGAVDFVQKPFHTSELMARVRRHLRALPTPREHGDDRFLTAGGIRLDLDRRRASGSGFDVVLTEREFGLLAHLMRRRGEVCRKDELLHDIWGLEFDPGSNVVEVCMRRLRSKLDEPPIETIRGVGYCFYGS